MTRATPATSHSMATMTRSVSALTSAIPMRTVPELTLVDSVSKVARAVVCALPMREVFA